MMDRGQDAVSELNRGILQKREGDWFKNFDTGVYTPV
jgi:hypothetical protein